MSGYLPFVNAEFEFHGDKITCKIKSPSRQDALALNRHLPEKDVARTPETDEQMLNVFADVLPKYVSEFVGLKDANGAPVSFETVCNDFYFVELMSAVGQRVLGAGIPPMKRSAAS